MNGAPSTYLESLGHPCWYCRWWGGPSGHSHGLCERPGGNCKTAMPERGCAFYEREPGADDDGWVPTWEPLPQPVPPRPRAVARDVYDRSMPLTLDATHVRPDQLARGRDIAHRVFTIAGIDARDAWVAFSAGVRGEAWSTWVLAEAAALDAALIEGTRGRLVLTDDD